MRLSASGTSPAASAEVAASSSGWVWPRAISSALLGRRHARPAAGEQGIADLGLQFLQQAADRGLRAAKQTPGSGDAARGHDGREGLELTKFHLSCFMPRTNSCVSSMRSANN